MKSKWLDFWVRIHLLFLPFGFLDFGNPYFNINFITSIVLILSVNINLLGLFSLKNDISSLALFLAGYLVYLIGISLINFKSGTTTSSSELRMQVLYIFSFFTLLYFFNHFPNKIYYIKRYLIFGIVVLTILASFNIGVEEVGKYERIRIFGMNPNSISFFLIISIMYFVNDLFENSSFFSVLIKFLLVALGLAFFIRLGSLNNLFALIVALTMYFLMNEGRLLKRVRIVILGLIIFIPIFYFIIKSDTYSARLRDTENLENLSGRKGLWELGVGMAKNNYIFGSGVYQARSTIRTALGNEVSLHNTYLDLFVNTGLVGFSLFLVFLFKTIKRLFVITKEFRNPIFLCLGVISVINILSGQFSFLFFTYLLYVSIPIGENLLVKSGPELIKV